ncbi:MAG: DUF2382 domain-containing protein [Methanosarcina sp.]
MQERIGKKSWEEAEAIENTMTPDDIIIPVIEEEIVIDKKIIEKGGIIIDKKIITQDVSIDASLKSEQLNIERVPLNQYVETRPEIRYEGETMIIPVLKEVYVKRLFLVEEIRIKKEELIQPHTENVTLRKEEITISRKND